MAFGAVTRSDVSEGLPVRGPASVLLAARGPDPRQRAEILRSALESSVLNLFASQTMLSQFSIACAAYSDASPLSENSPRLPCS